MLKASFKPYTLKFLETAITSRAHMREKDTYIVTVWDDINPDIAGYGECALFRGLSEEDSLEYESQLSCACLNPINLPKISSIRFGFESALAMLNAGGSPKFIDNEFTRGARPIQINGLIWMGDKRTMTQRIREKLDAGFTCIKLKIGGIDFNDEIDLLKMIRSEFGSGDLELRLDANGAFSATDALAKLKRLSEFSIHSIEQPIKAGQADAMAELCQSSPIKVALDEELIGFRTDSEKTKILDTIKPAYIILKPSLCGGFEQADRWINLAVERGIKWWATSALESNIGLSAIAQWVSRYPIDMPQGLGTGALYSNNFPTPLHLEGDKLYFKV